MQKYIEGSKIASVPHHCGQTNEPAFVSHVGRFVAQLRGETETLVARATSDNFFKLFGIEALNVSAV